ncbi:MAG TPA: TonB-dependent receptor [Acidobacteriaceae bacterium]
MSLNLQQRKTRRGWETVAGWKLRSVGAVLAVGVAMGLGVRAQAASNTNSVTVAGDEAPEGQSGPAAKHAFNIPAGPLTGVLDAFRQATGLRVHLRISADELVGFRSAGVVGTYTNEAALQQILDKTGLSYSLVSANVVEIALRNSERVDVTTSVASVELQQFTGPLVDTAQTVNVVPQFIMQEQAATNLRDTLRNVPGISLAAGEGGSQGDTLTIRGFNARNDIFLDGIRDFGSYYRDAFNFEAVEVLEGPAGVEFGRGSTGGVVNQESKQPELAKFAHANLQFGTNLMRRASADINQPLRGLGEGAAFRLNVVGSQSMVAGRNIAETRRFGIAPAVSFGLNTPTRYVLQYLHESENSTPDYGLPYFGPAVVNVDHSTYYGFAADNYLRTNPDIVTGKVEHDIGKGVTVRNVLRWANYPRDVRITEPQINTVATTSAVPMYTGGTPTPILATCAQNGADVTKSCFSLDTPLSQVRVKRNQLTARSTEDLLWDQASVTTHFEVFHIPNNLVAIAEGGRERSDPYRNSYNMPYVPVLSPNPYDPFIPTSAYPGIRSYVVATSYGLGFVDTVKLREWLQLSGGVRFDHFNTHSYAAANPLAATLTPAYDVNRLDEQPTYRAAVVVKPSHEGSIYFDYGTSFNPSAEALSLSANNATSPPEYNTTYEAGVKWEYFHDRLHISSSIFRTEKQNARETDPANSANTVNAGDYVVRGVQFGAIGHLPENFDLIVGYAYLDSFIESSALNASPFNAVNLALISANDPRANTAPFFISPKGMPIANTPKNSANFWVTHKLIRGFTGGLGANFLTARRASSSAYIGLYNSSAPIDLTQVRLVPKAIPGYYALNLMVSRKITRSVDFQANINNLTNKFYIDQPHPNHLVPGEGINAQFGFNYKF